MTLSPETIVWMVSMPNAPHWIVHKDPRLLLRAGGISSLMKSDPALRASSILLFRQQQMNTSL